MTRIVSWDTNAINDGTNYLAWFTQGDGLGKLAEVEAVLNQRTGYWPLVGDIARPGRQLKFLVAIVGASKATLKTQLFKWFKPDPPLLDWTGAPVKQLVIENDDGTLDRYVEAVCTSIRVVSGTAERGYVVTLEVHKDTAWRNINNSSFSTWNLAFDVGVNSLTPAGEDIVYPIIDIKPKAAKSGDFAYKRFVPLRWPSPNGATRYPVDIANGALDTASLTTAKMQADGDDLRVRVNGTQIDRWLAAMDTANTKVWVNLDFVGNVTMTLAAAIAGSGDVDTITVNENIAGLRPSGIVQIGSEFFLYTGKIDSEKLLTGVSRAAHGSTAAAHSVSDSVYWLQHEIYIIYGNSSVSAPAVDDNYKPAFNLSTSSNTSWDYDDFAEADGLRAASWVPYSIQGVPAFYGGSQNTEADPYAELGLSISGFYYTFPHTGVWLLQNVCGITAANFQNGEQYASTLGTLFPAEIVSQTAAGTLALEATISPPGTLLSWQSWSQNETLNSGAIGVGLRVSSPGDIAGIRSVEAADVTVTLNSSNTPVTSIGSEQGGYLLNLTLTNLKIQTQALGGLQMRVNFLMDLNQTLRVDTYNKTVTYLKDNSNQAQAVDLVGAIRRDWWPLYAGEANSVGAEDEGTTDLDIDISYTPRYFT